MPKLHDPICAFCKNRDSCKNPCYPITWINGKARRKETLVERMTVKREDQDYNSSLAEMIEDKRQTDHDRLEYIRGVSDLRRRLVLAALHVGVPQDIIATEIHISQQHISRIYRDRGQD